MPHFRKFVEHYHNTNIEDFNYQQIAQYIDNEAKNTDSDTSRLHMICAIKYYYENLLGRERMTFKLRETRKVKNTGFVLPVDKLLPLLKVIKEPRIKLLFLLKFSYAINPTRIAAISLTKFKEWLITGIFVKHPGEKPQLFNLVKDYYLQYKPTEYLFEKTKSTMYQPTEIGKMIQNAIRDYGFIEPYKVVLQQFMTSAGFKHNTAKTYKNLLLQFFKAHNYRDFEEISNEEIRQFLHNLGKNKKMPQVLSTNTSMPLSFTTLMC